MSLGIFPEEKGRIAGGRGGKRDRARRKKASTQEREKETSSRQISRKMEV